MIIIVNMDINIHIPRSSFCSFSRISSIFKYGRKENASASLSEQHGILQTNEPVQCVMHISVYISQAKGASPTPQHNAEIFYSG